MPEEGCICLRPKQIVLCANCGTCLKGRIRCICPKHPNVLFSHDFQDCPKCHRLDLLTECDLKRSRIERNASVTLR